jgi:hypothetical protein
MKVHNFKVSGGNKVVDGKSHWPDCLNLSMGRFYAWELVNGLLYQLRQGEKDITYSTCGKLECDVEEG